jgi:hypothetical protein
LISQLATTIGDPRIYMSDYRVTGVTYGDEIDHVTIDHESRTVHLESETHYHLIHGGQCPEF